MELLILHLAKAYEIFKRLLWDCLRNIYEQVKKRAGRAILGVLARHWCREGRKTHKENKDTQGGECYVKTHRHRTRKMVKVEIEVTPLQAKECLGLPETERDKERFYPRDIRGSITLPMPWFWTSRFHNCKTTNFCCLSCPVHSTLLRHLYEINTTIFSKGRNPLWQRVIVSFDKYILNFYNMSNTTLYVGDSAVNRMD